MNLWRQPLAHGLLLAAALVPIARAQRRSVVAVGDVPSYRFEEPLLGGPGIRRLEDLRGRPVLIDFWGVKCPPCISFAVPKAQKLKMQHGEDLAVLFVERQGSSIDDVAAFALQEKWLGNETLWTTECVFDTGLRGLPHSALLSAQGEVVLVGYTREIDRELERTIEDLVRQCKEGPPGTPESLGLAWKAMSEGAYSKAMAIARRSTEDSVESHAELAAEALNQFTQRVESELARAEWQVNHGYMIEGLLRLKRLSTGLADEAWLLAKVERLIRDVGSRSLEMKAARALQELEKKVYAVGPDPQLGVELSRFAEEYRGLPTSKRALWLASLIDASECGTERHDR